MEALDNETAGLATALQGIGGIHRVNKRSRIKKNKNAKGESLKTIPEQTSETGAIPQTQLLINLDAEELEVPELTWSKRSRGANLIGDSFGGELAGGSGLPKFGTVSGTSQAMLR